MHTTIAAYFCRQLRRAKVLASMSATAYSAGYCCRQATEPTWLISFPALLQATYHGFGIIVKPEVMVKGNGRPIQKALQSVLEDPAFKVSALAVQ